MLPVYIIKLYTSAIRILHSIKLCIDIFNVPFYVVCLLTIPNGNSTYSIPSTEYPEVLVITYTCDAGYQFKSGTEEQIHVCVNGTMATVPPPCERKSYSYT